MTYLTKVCRLSGCVYAILCSLLRQFKRGRLGTMVGWDLYPACRSCLHAQGVFCSQTTPCVVCRAWSPQQWKSYQAAELRSSARKRLIRQEAQARKAASLLSPAGETHRSRSPGPTSDLSRLTPSQLMLPPVWLPSRRVAVTDRYRTQGVSGTG